MFLIILKISYLLDLFTLNKKKKLEKNNLNFYSNFLKNKIELDKVIENF